MIRPFNQFRKIGGRKAGYLDDGDPVKTPPVSGRLNPRNTRQLNKAIGGDPSAETPPFRMTGFEISEFLTTHGVDKKIVRLLIEGFGGTRKSTTKFLQLRDVHIDWPPRGEAEWCDPTPMYPTHSSVSGMIRSQTNIDADSGATELPVTLSAVAS